MAFLNACGRKKTRFIVSAFQSCSLRAYQSAESNPDAYLYNGNEKNSIYWDRYSEQINEMANTAGEMYEELRGIRQRLFYHYGLPYKKLEFCEDDMANGGHTDISWWNMAACMLSDADMVCLLENEENDGYFDVEKEKMKRIHALECLTKRQQMALYTEATGFIMRYLELRAAFETILAVINELEYNQSFAAKNGEVKVPDVTYV